MFIKQIIKSIKNLECHLVWELTIIQFKHCLEVSTEEFLISVLLDGLKN